MTLIELQPLLRNMPAGHHQAVDSLRHQQSPTRNAEEVLSYRSRASSVISTGTKFSIATTTHQQGPLNSSHNDHDHDHYGGTTPLVRQNSLLSTHSFTPSLPPPYEEDPIQIPPATSDHHYNNNNNDDDEPDPPPDTDPDTANALSIHYSRIVRTIDATHAHQLARLRSAHEASLSSTRESIDRAYRIELDRVRDEAAAESQRALAEQAERIAILEAQAEKRVQRARNEVEDLWEGRWADRMRVAGEEAGRREGRWREVVGRVCGGEVGGRVLREMEMGKGGGDR